MLYENEYRNHIFECESLDIYAFAFIISGTKQFIPNYLLPLCFSDDSLSFNDKENACH